MSSPSSSTSLQNNHEKAVQPSSTEERAADINTAPWTLVASDSGSAMMERSLWQQHVGNGSSWGEPSIEAFEIATKWQQYFLVGLYSATAALALLGNVLSILVLMRGKRSSRDLRLFLVNLSLSDILMSIFSIPFTYTNFILGRWIFGPETCPLVQSMQLLSVFVSIYTLTIIGVDRYIAITRPFIKSLWSRSVAPIIVALTWLIGFLLSLVIWFSSKAEELVVGNVTYYDCRENWANPHQEQIYTVTLFLVVFAIPLLILIYVYGSISLTLWSHSAPGNANAVRDGVQSQAKIKVIKMLITIVVLFAICWLPIHLFQLIRVFNQELLKRFIDYDASNVRYLFIVIASHWLSMANSFVNPMIYCFMSDNFRIDLKDIAKRCLRPPRWCCGQQVDSTLSPTSLVMEPCDDNGQCSHHHHGHRHHNGRHHSGQVVCYPLVVVSNGGCSQANSNASNGQRTSAAGGVCVHRNGINVHFKMRPQEEDKEKCHCRVITTSRSSKERHKIIDKRSHSISSLNNDSRSSSSESICSRSSTGHSESNGKLNSYSRANSAHQANSQTAPNGPANNSGRGGTGDNTKSISETKT